MSNNAEYNGSERFRHIGCQFTDETSARLLEEVKGLRDDFKTNYNLLLNRATERVDNVIPIKSHYLILVGGLVVLLGVAIVKEFLTKT